MYVILDHDKIEKHRLDGYKLYHFALTNLCYIDVNHRYVDTLSINIVELDKLCSTMPFYFI